MTRDELLDLLRRELTTGEWSELRPGERLVEIESKLDELTERTNELRRTYDELQAEDLLQALDDLAAAASYLREDAGVVFSEVTRLADELRAARRRATGDGPRQVGLAVSDDSADDADGPVDEDSPGRQPDLFE